MIEANQEELLMEPTNLILYLGNVTQHEATHNVEVYMLTSKGLELKNALNSIMGDEKIIKIKIL